MSLKTVLAGVLLLASGATLQAQEIVLKDPIDNRFEIIAGLGIAPMTAWYDTGIGAMDFWYDGPLSVQKMYDCCYDATYSPTYSIELAYHLKNRWDLCASMGFATVSVDRFDPFSNQKLNHEDLYSFDIQVGVRRYHVAKRVFRMYSQITVGAGFFSKSGFWDIVRKYNEAQAPKNLAFQVTGLGLTLGKKAFASTEFGWGSDYMAFGVIPGFKLGLGYRF